MDGLDQDLTGFTASFLLTEGIGITLVSLMSIWLLHYRGGFAWQSDPSHQFNWHPFLMTFAMIFLFGNSILIYRSRYSLHSWVGLSAFVLFIIQWIFGFITFLLPGLTSSIRSWFLPKHVFFGLFIFILCCCAALMGILEKAIFAIKNYKDGDSESILVNCIGLLIIVFACFVVSITVTKKYKLSTQLDHDERLLSSSINE